MTSGPDHDLVVLVKAALVERADLERAAGQQRYMKSAMPFLGLTSPQLKAAIAPLLGDPGLAQSREPWEATIREVWDGATHPEQWYAAIAPARHRSYRAWVDSDAMPLWESLLRVGACWDVVDDISTRLDQCLPADVIETNIDNGNFFSRKAIGRALRDHARIDPEWVRAFVDAHPNLSRLSRREALKHLEPRR